MSRWEEALDLVIDVHRFWASKDGPKFGDIYIESLIEGGISPHTSVAEWTADPGNITGANIAESLAHMAINADPIWVERDMWNLVKAAAQDWPGESLRATDLPTESGFMLLPEQLIIPTEKGDLSVRAINWAPVEPSRNGNGPGILLAFYHRSGDRDAFNTEDPLIEARVTGWWMTHVVPWQFDTDPEGLLPRTDNFDLAKHLQVCWRLMQQEITVRDTREAGGQFAKRAGRAGFPDSNVLVVTLRRPKHKSTDEHFTVDWKVQWIVSSHWRNQWYPSISGHRLIRIGEYIKGPEDMPLAPKKVRVLQFVR